MRNVSSVPSMGTLGSSDSDSKGPDMTDPESTNGGGVPEGHEEQPDPRSARETVDRLEEEVVNPPTEETTVDPEAATDSETGDPDNPEAGDAEPPD